MPDVEELVTVYAPQLPSCARRRGNVALNRLSKRGDVITLRKYRIPACSKTRDIQLLKFPNTQVSRHRNCVRSRKFKIKNRNVAFKVRNFRVIGHFERLLLASTRQKRRLIGDPSQMTVMDTTTSIVFSAHAVPSGVDGRSRGTL